VRAVGNDPDYGHAHISLFGLAAKHLDQTMRKGQGSMSADTFEKVLSNIVDLVKFTKDKDVFKEFYITQLAKRLLLGRSASTEEEINMVKKLQTGAYELGGFRPLDPEAEIVFFHRVR